MEVAPGVFLSSMIPPGQYFEIDLEAFGIGEGRGWAIHPDDWNKMDSVERERALDTITRADAERGHRRLERWLSERSQ